MAFRVPDSKRSIAQNRYFFELPDKDGNVTEYDVVKAKYLSVGQIENLQKNKSELTLTDMLDLFDGEAASTAVRSLDMEQLQALLADWQEDSGLTVGESSASEPNS